MNNKPDLNMIFIANENERKQLMKSLSRLEELDPPDRVGAVIEKAELFFKAARDGEYNKLKSELEETLSEVWQQADDDVADAIGFYICREMLEVLIESLQSRKG